MKKVVISLLLVGITSNLYSMNAVRASGRAIWGHKYISAGVIMVPAAATAAYVEFPKFRLYANRCIRNIGKTAYILNDAACDCVTKCVYLAARGEKWVAEKVKEGCLKIDKIVTEKLPEPEA